MNITQWFMTFKADIFLFNSSLPRAKSKTRSPFLVAAFYLDLTSNVEYLCVYQLHVAVLF